MAMEEMAVILSSSSSASLLITITTLALCLLLLSPAAVQQALGAPEHALITSIPGFVGPFPSKHYAGYVTVNATHGRSLYYYFVESESNPATDPVVLWLNGGPGCSSFDGFIYEHGPFNFEPGFGANDLPTLTPNPYAWAKVSNPNSPYFI
jgi:serine carboxypeptidase-like clade 1